MARGRIAEFSVCYRPRNDMHAISQHTVSHHGSDFQMSVMNIRKNLQYFQKSCMLYALDLHDRFLSYRGHTWIVFMSCLLYVLCCYAYLYIYTLMKVTIPQLRMYWQVLTLHVCFRGLFYIDEIIALHLLCIKVKSSFLILLIKQILTILSTEGLKMMICFVTSNYRCQMNVAEQEVHYFLLKCSGVEV